MGHPKAQIEYGTFEIRRGRRQTPYVLYRYPFLPIEDLLFGM